MPTTSNQKGREPSPTASPLKAEVSLCSGYGACSKDCNCQAFEGNAGTCGNQGCGHAYEDHW
jgi:hypothetical protein